MFFYVGSLITKKHLDLFGVTLFCLKGYIYIPGGPKVFKSGSDDGILETSRELLKFFTVLFRRIDCQVHNLLCINSYLTAVVLPEIHHLLWRYCACSTSGLGLSCLFSLIWKVKDTVRHSFYVKNRLERSIKLQAIWHFLYILCSNL